MAEQLDASQSGGEDAQDVMRLLLIASLANVPNALKGLAVPEIVAALCAPGRDVSRIKNEVIARLATVAWYLHSTNDGRLHVRNVQNLIARVTTTAGAYLRDQATREVKERLTQIFAPDEGTCYQRLLPLPAVDEIDVGAERVTRVAVAPCGRPGPVLMVLRKQTTDDTAFLDEVVPEVEAEVERQLASMRELDDRDAPNFSDADYQLAAYAAALRVLTNYRAIEDVDVAYELSRERGRGEVNPLAWIIEDAVRTASNFLVPAGLPAHVWLRLTPEEKLYLKGLEVESHGDFRAGVYQEFARGFGVADYRRLLHTGKANQTRLKTATELQRADLTEAGLLRHALYAVWRAAESGDVTDSLTWLHTELADYWSQREAVAAVLRCLAALDIDHWRTDADAARLLAGAVENDYV